MLAELFDSLHDRGIDLTIVNAHGQVRDLLRADGLDTKFQGIARGTTIEDSLRTISGEAAKVSPS